jgi:hypothetical protein
VLKNLTILRHGRLARAPSQAIFKPIRAAVDRVADRTFPLCEAVVFGVSRRTSAIPGGDSSF